MSVEQELVALRREIANFSPRVALIASDASWITRALKAEAEVARLKAMPAAKIHRKRHPLIVHAEACVLFDGGYVQPELRRLTDKLERMNAGTFDAACAAEDTECQTRNAASAHRAIAMEDEAHQLAVGASLTSAASEQIGLFGEAA